MVTAAIDLGGTNIKMGLVESGEVKHQTIISSNSEKTLSERLERIKISIEEIMKNTKADAIGFSFPGIVDPYKKKILTTVGKFEDATELDLEKWCADNFGLPMVIDNDANAALMGEVAYGEGKGFENAVMMILGTGVGTAAYMDGKLVRGKHFQAGCIGGHFKIDIDGRNCGCGGKGCIEAYAGTWALKNVVSEDELFPASGLSKEEKIDFMALEKWYKRKDPLAEKVFHECIKMFSTCAINLVHAYDPEVVIVSGGVMNFRDILAPLKSSIEKNIFTPWGIPEIRCSVNNQQSVLKGLHRFAELSI